jgi:hypothetical protein
LPQFCGSLPRSAVHVSGVFDVFSSPAEQAPAANDGRPRRMKPRSSQRKRERSLEFEDRMGEPFMTFI